VRTGVSSYIEVLMMELAAGYETALRDEEGSGSRREDGGTNSA